MRRGVPLAFQIIALLVAGLVLGQAATFAIIVLTPPPRPSVYRIEDVAAALKGQKVDSRFGAPLMRHTQVGPPLAEPAVAHSGRHAEGLRLELASQLGLDPARVRLALDEGMMTFAIKVHYNGDMAALMRGEGPPPPGEGPPPPLGPAPPPPEWRPRRHHLRPGLLVGDFRAAMQSPSGGWIVVEAAPEPFPNPWQARLMLWFLACLAVLVPAGYVFARRLTAPLSAFAKAADRLGRDPGAAAIPLKGPAEIGVAASAFNQMQERLARYVKDRTAMIGAVAHDLRTPIARIQFKLQRLDPAAWNAIGSDLAQMEEMIAGVLAFVRDASHAPERAALDLRSVLECVADDAEAMGREVALAEGPSPVIDADAGAIRRLFDNLVGNAVTYGQRARIDLAVENGLAIVTIADDGPGLPQAEVERVFEPFFRTEASRNRDTGGIGLGLTVARSLARAHGGDVVLANAGQSVGGCGLIATVSLPLSRQ